MREFNREWIPALRTDSVGFMHSHTLSEAQQEFLTEALNKLGKRHRIGNIQFQLSKAINLFKYITGHGGVYHVTNVPICFFCGSMKECQVTLMKPTPVFHIRFESYQQINPFVEPQFFTEEGRQISYPYFWHQGGTRSVYCMICNNCETLLIQNARPTKYQSQGDIMYVNQFVLPRSIRQWLLRYLLKDIADIVEDYFFQIESPVGWEFSEPRIINMGSSES